MIGVVNLIPGETKKIHFWGLQNPKNEKMRVSGSFRVCR